jgi:hypothetical protein
MDHIVAALAACVPELGPAQDVRDGFQTAAGEPEGKTHPAAEGAQEATEPRS